MLLGSSKLSLILLLLLSLYGSIFLSILIRHVSVIHTLFLQASISFFLYLVPQIGRSISM